MTNSTEVNAKQIRKGDVLRFTGGNEEVINISTQTIRGQKCIVLTKKSLSKCKLTGLKKGNVSTFVCSPNVLEVFILVSRNLTIKKVSSKRVYLGESFDDFDYQTRKIIRAYVYTHTYKVSGAYIESDLGIKEFRKSLLNK